MLGFTRCASTSCFTQAAEFISGVPLCPEHLVALEEHFTPSPPSVPTSAPTKRVRERKPGEVRITSRVSLTPYQASVDPATALDLGCVYYLTSRRNAEAVRIGTTSRARRRFQSLSASAGERLRFLVAEPGGLEQEQYRHRQFADIRVPGTEYFQYTQELVDHIAALRTRYPNYRDLTDVGRSFD